MPSVLLYIRRMSESRPHWTRIRDLLFAFALAALICGVIGVQPGRAQGTGQSGNAEGSAQGTGQSSNSEGSAQAPAPSSGAEGSAQGTGQSSNAEGSAQGAGQGSNSEGSAQAPAASDAAQAPAESGGATASPAQSGHTQAPAQNSRAKAAGAHATPEGTGSESGQSESQEIQQPYPYQSLPSLRDLYTQVPSTGGRLQRFGSNAFSFGTGNANELPMDLPAGPDYVLGPGDSLIVNIWGGQSDRLNRTIDRQGQIELPEAGTIMINGMTIAQAQSAIQHALSAQFQNEHVEISLGRLRSVRIYVVGDVQRPGAYDVSSLSTPLSALYAAGGPTSRGSLRLLRQLRGNQLVREIDLYDFLLKGVRSDVERLLPGDTLLVPPVGPQVSVEGMVHRPAIYELNGEKTLKQVLDLAGGILSAASLKQINVARIVANERRTMLSLELPNNPAEVAQKLAGFPVQGGDDVVISQILPYNQDAVYLEGHVYRPGTYPYKDGMTINDLLHSYQDVLPEPADHAELFRLLPPDFRPEVISFNLHDALIGNDSFLLEPFDSIHVFGRYEIDPPMVSIRGDVLRPGAYPMSQGMTVAGLVRMAGGFIRSAYRDEADLSSYVVQNGQKALVSHRIVAVEKALDGDKDADVTLSPGDVLSIQQLAGWLDIGSSVTISGEVEHTGSYAIEPGEHLSSLLKRAGGFREDAYPPAAVVERVQVRILAEQARQQMIQRIENTPAEARQGAMPTQAAADLQHSVEMQRQDILAKLRNLPASGRLVINISSDVSRWEGTPADIELRAGDSLVIPKRPDFVVVSGQVYNPAAISYVPGRDLTWYLRKAGGATSFGDKKDIYVLHADGSVVPRGNSWVSNNFMNLRMRPGDTIFVPEKIVGGSTVWQNVTAVVQAMAAAALPVAIIGSY
jgi:protein involved in polysaccharide export with SLBB domain